MPVSAIWASDWIFHQQHWQWSDKKETLSNNKKTECS